MADAGKIDETMPVSVIAREARRFEAEHYPDMTERHLCGPRRANPERTAQSPEPDRAKIL